jgi:hypothetical protein
MRRFGFSSFIFGVLFAVCSAMGCGYSSTSRNSADPSPEFHLAAEPEGAVEVLDAKDQAKDGEPIVVVGRLGGGLTPWVDGRAAFLLVDTRILPACDEDSECETDCAFCAKEMMAASTMVKFIGNDGKVLPVDARTLLGVKEEETVVVQGVANRDKEGNVSIAAKGIFVRR